MPASGSGVLAFADGSETGLRPLTRRSLSEALAVLAELRDGLEGARSLAIHEIRRARLPEAARRILDEDAALLHVDVVEDGLSTADRSDGNSEQRGARDDLGRRVAGREGPHDRVPLVHPRHARPDLRPLGLCEQILALDQQQEVRELLVGVGVEADPAVEGRLDRRHLHRPRWRQQLGPTHQAVHEIHVGRRADVHDLAQREIDQLSLPRVLRPGDARQARDRGERAADPLGDAPAAHDRGLGLEAADGEGATVGLDREVAGRLLRERSPAAVGRDAEHHEPRESVAQVELLDHPRLERLDHEIGAGDQREDMLVAGLAHDRFLRGIEELEEGAVPSVELLIARAPTPQRVTALRLDLDHLGVRIGEQLRRVGPRDPIAEIDDAQMAKTLHGRLLSPRERRAR